ncbi:hypothetical protein GCM10008915_77420 [Bifidobacterium pullorum subsp. gallinarum]
MKYQGYYNLIQEILILTRSDLKIRGKKKGHFYQIRQDAIAFIHTDWFDSLCYSVNLEPDAVRVSFLDDTIQHSRKYRATNNL